MSTIEDQIPTLVPNTQIGGDALGLVKNGGNVVINSDGTMDTNTSDVWEIYTGLISDLIVSNYYTKDVLVEYNILKDVSGQQIHVTSGGISFYSNTSPRIIECGTIQAGYKNKISASSSINVCSGYSQKFCNIIFSDNSVTIDELDISSSSNSWVERHSRGSYTDIIRIITDGEISNNQYRIWVK